MTDVKALAEKALRQISSTEGVLEALGENLKRAYGHVEDQLTHNPGDEHLVEQRNELDQLIDRFSATVAKALLTVGLSHITKDDVATAVKQRM